MHKELSTIFRLTPLQKDGLKKLGISTVRDLLYYFPIRYGDYSTLTPINKLTKGKEVIIFAEVISIKPKKTWKTGIAMTEVTLKDTHGDTIKAVWFSQPYISKILSIGTQGRFSGVVQDRDGVLYLANPEYDTKDVPIEKTTVLFSQQSSDELMIYPVYKETKGITSRWIFHKIKKVLTDHIPKDIVDPIPVELLEKYNLPGLYNALIYIHSPRKHTDAEAAKKRFAFQEILIVQLIKQSQKKEYDLCGAFPVSNTNPVTNDFINSLPFSLTQGQQKAIDTILTDINSDSPMSRLLEGDVGSGKTIIAAAASITTATTRPDGQKTGYLQVAYMAPTEILAKQIFTDFVNLFSKHRVSIGLLTSKTCLKYPSKVSRDPTTISKAQLKKWVLQGEIQILVGTHALISKNVFFENLGLVIIDEQHRFGKKQRAALRAKPQEKKDAVQASTKLKKAGVIDSTNTIPHLLSMTATPIPRTLALTIYGDLDLTVLDELPPGRKKIETILVDPTDEARTRSYTHIRKELEQGRQLYVICPRIFDADPDRGVVLSIKSAVSEADRLRRTIFPEYSIGPLHSKLSKQEKERVMNDFTEGTLDILVSTSVVEVGVNVPNATIIIIEGAERFGLSQLHQLRGRVMRSSHQPYCYLFSDAKTEQTAQRLSALMNAQNGFELAEYDLEFRGTGEMLGSRQSGLSDMAMEAIKNPKLVEAARDEARLLLEAGITFKPLQQEVSALSQELHLE